MSRILWFHPRSRWPTKGGGDLRTAGLIGCAVASGHEVLLVSPPHEAAPEIPGVHLLTFAGHHGARLWAAKLLSRQPLRSPRLARGDVVELRGRIADFAPEVAVVSEIMSWSIARRVLPEGLPWIYDAPNVESVLFRSLAEAVSGPIDRLTFNVDARRVSRVERVMLTGSTHVMAASERDAHELEKLMGGGSVTVVPSSVPLPERPAAPHLAPPDVLFVGSLNYPPNEQAVAELLDEIMPRLREQLTARLVVVGRHPPGWMADRISRADWAELHADVEGVSPFYQRARCVVLPIRSGSGTKLKVYEALAQGVPVVATDEAIAGIAVGDRVLSAESTADLVVHAASVLRDPELARNLGAQGRLLFETSLSWRAVAPALDRVLTSARGVVSTDE